MLNYNYLITNKKQMKAEVTNLLIATVPTQIIMNNFKFDKLYKETFTLKNTADFTVIVNLVSSDPQKIYVKERVIKLRAYQSVEVTLKIKVKTQFNNIHFYKNRANNYILIRNDVFDFKLPIVFYPSDILLTDKDQDSFIEQLEGIENNKGINKIDISKSKEKRNFSTNVSKLNKTERIDKRDSRLIKIHSKDFIVKPEDSFDNSNPILEVNPSQATFLTASYLTRNISEKHENDLKDMKDHHIKTNKLNENKVLQFKEIKTPNFPNKHQTEKLKSSNFDNLNDIQQNEQNLTKINYNNKEKSKIEESKYGNKYRPDYSKDSSYLTKTVSKNSPNRIQKSASSDKKSRCSSSNSNKLNKLQIKSTPRSGKYVLSSKNPSHNKISSNISVKKFYSVQNSKIMIEKTTDIQYYPIKKPYLKLSNESWEILRNNTIEKKYFELKALISSYNERLNNFLVSQTKYMVNYASDIINSYPIVKDEETDRFIKNNNNINNYSDYGQKDLYYLLLNQFTSIQTSSSQVFLHSNNFNNFNSLFFYFNQTQTSFTDFLSNNFNYLKEQNSKLLNINQEMMELLQNEKVI